MSQTTVSGRKSTPDHYGSVAVAIHWLSALLILGLLVAGLVAANIDDSDRKALLLAVHMVVGITVLLLTLFRIAWWWFADRKPDPVAGMPRWQEASARAVHILLYVVVLVLAVSGIALVITSEAVPVLFGGDGALPDFWDFTPRLPHRVLAFTLIGLIVLHVGAAIYHQVVMKDRLLDRMTPKRSR